ncbi:dihydroorotate dehydrogenase electron transfer subunit [Pullulanibacillus pueri]|uniref:Dihydroorotate dehydrogenase B (NAD(+)), electron transfer subunit n=1 Tax=Pullulanibacillus pueri TaxID=1437324 RepID=A0A8J3EPB1_9BACL|nr:dihydroorotate dehydrogenase electron transfer subunit [Pullulanibacillus pueri]MBM7684083.1 dihydroorotate dehydrogenase electron transfer subunit [Pullulanibacillus pueri]GGH88603.1 dihydroorotate dehydrogenase B (NAD(+)), electron transfer subunit [Pullulanibacillus pueri]
MKAYDLKLLSNRQVSARYWHMVVDASAVEDNVQPGQFFNIRCGNTYSPLLRRPFSIYRINKNTLEFLYLVKGEGTKKLTELEKGETINLFGPLGVPFSLEKEDQTILLLARGVGIATLAALAQEANEMGIKTVAILSARTRDDLLATEALHSFGAEVYKVTEEEGTSDVENVRQILHRILDTHLINRLFTCGSKRLSVLLQGIGKERGIPGQIALEEHMGCGMGVCYACVCDIQRSGAKHSVKVCQDGPVFSLEEVVLA